MNALGRAPRAVLAVGALAGAVFAGLLAPQLRPLFHPPGGGIGALTVAGYPKSFDYFLMSLLAGASCAGAVAAGILSGRSAAAFSPGEASGALAGRRHYAIIVAFFFGLTFAGYALVHNHPYYELDFFHDGEHLSPAMDLLSGARPYRDVFFLHGFAVDGGLDALFLGSAPDPLRVRRATALLDAAAVAALVLVAGECLSTWPGLVVAVILSLCAIGAGQVDVFPYFRLGPILIALWSLLRFFRTRSTPALLVAGVSATLGILWSLEVGLYATASVLIALLFDRFAFPSRVLAGRTLALLAAAGLAAPLLILLFARADVAQFLRDSLLIIPGAIDAVWSLPAPPVPDLRSLLHPVRLWLWLDSESARYFLPPVFYGFTLALAARESGRRQVWSAQRFLTLGVFAIFLLRTAVGRAGWSHIRFAAPLLGMALVAGILEPMWQRLIVDKRRRWMLASGIVLILVPLSMLLELPENIAAARTFLSGRAERAAPSPGSVPYPLASAARLYTYPQNAADLTALARFVHDEVPPGKTIFIFSGEKALYYLLQRHSATRVQDVAMLSAPRLQRQAMKQLRRNPPALVIVHGLQGLDEFDGVSNRVRVPAIAAWIDREYPRRVMVGRFLIALPPLSSRAPL